MRKIVIEYKSCFLIRLLRGRKDTDILFYVNMFPSITKRNLRHIKITERVSSRKSKCLGKLFEDNFY
jgi:hypothetical protein